MSGGEGATNGRAGAGNGGRASAAARDRCGLGDIGDTTGARGRSAPARIVPGRSERRRRGGRRAGGIVGAMREEVLFIPVQSRLFVRVVVGGARQRFDPVPVRWGMFDRVEQLRPHIEHALAPFGVATDAAGIGEQEDGQPLVIAGAGADLFAGVKDRLFHPVQRAFERDMGELLQPEFERCFPGEVEGLAREPRAQAIGGLARHAGKGSGVLDRGGADQRVEKDAHLRAGPDIMATPDRLHRGRVEQRGRAGKAERIAIVGGVFDVVGNAARSAGHGQSSCWLRRVTIRLSVIGTEGDRTDMLCWGL